MNARPFLVGFVTIGIFSGNTSPSVRAESPCTSCLSGSPGFDSISGLCLPDSVEGFKTARLSKFRSAALRGYRHTISAGFNQPKNSLAVTLFLYDRAGSEAAADAEEVRSAMDEVLATHDGSRLEVAGKGVLPILGERVEASGGVVTWNEGDTSYTSLLWVVPRGNRFLKIRATYVRPNGAEDEAMRFALESVNKIVGQICDSTRR